ncbi:unnamed protein product [Alternaria alternata]
MTPAWDLPIFPFMLSGTLAAIGAGHQAEAHAVAMIVAGLTAQGLGMTVSLLMAVVKREILTEGKDEDTYVGEEKPKVRRGEETVVKAQEKHV